MFERGHADSMSCSLVKPHSFMTDNPTLFYYFHFKDNASDLRLDFNRLITVSDFYNRVFF